VNAALVLDGNSSLSIGSQVGIGIAITFAWAVLNALRIDKQGWLNNLAAFVQISSAIIIAIVLLVMAPQRATAKDVFTSTYNGTGFPFGYVYCIGILSTLFSFSGYEGISYIYIADVGKNVFILFFFYSRRSFGRRDSRCYSCR
jgi:amino acid transporter